MDYIGKRTYMREEGLIVLSMDKSANTQPGFVKWQWRASSAGCLLNGLVKRSHRLLQANLRMVRATCLPASYLLTLAINYAGQRFATTTVYPQIVGLPLLGAQIRHKI